jgi:tetratricopeptide (TPR) repeat protein
MSLQLIDAKRPGEALAIATAARDGAKQAPPRVVAMMSVREALTHAALGDAAACERLLVYAEAAMCRADEVESPDWASSFDQAAYCAQVASCYLLLRRHQAADHWLDQSLDLHPAERRVDRTTYLMWRAEAVLELGNVDHACALVGQAVPSIAAVHSVRNQRRLSDLHQRLKVHKHCPAVVELDEQVRSLIA